ncbi:hypothetical protein OIE63_18875 [Streptomyces sp. NBC_01795]|uniref:hypothetical protein n=1 Tax=unclassified Streptomyces TaxID=2593676 RepID=UPI002DD7A55D|nr:MULTISPECIES: hypothetical protein [unclassified Streptomyces]WSA93414.1 hypothetical protein OIE63_18875 [Streptomyces sp. NBC_01795]WSS13969.1 hypothetical protein OG533_20345 [Streptomyces sp. NBC_01186]
MDRQRRDADAAHRWKPRPAHRRGFLLMVACCVFGVLVAACAPSDSDQASKASDQPAQPGASASVPIKLARAGTGRKMVVTIAVGDGEPVKVLLDTGSSGLVLKDSAFGKDQRPTGEKTKVTYGGFSLAGDIVKAPVRFTSATSDLATEPMKVASFHGDPTKTMASTGTVGILGIAAGTAASTTPKLLSPLVHLPEPYSTGFTIRGIREDLSSGKLSVGKVQETSDSVAVPMLKAGFTYPNGSPGYKKLIRLCWTVGDAKSCAKTSPDTGGTSGTVSSTLMPNAPRTGTSITKGTPITIGSDSKVLCRFEAGANRSTQPAPRLNDHPNMNTGIRFFFANTVGFDLKRGQVVITPDAAASRSHC